MSEDFDFSGFVQEDTESSPVRTITDNFAADPAFKLGIIGVGQCGNNIAQAFHRLGYRRVLLVNTAQTDLDAIADQIAKLPIDKQGAGKDPALGKAKVEAKSTQIRNGMLREFGEDFEKIVVCIGLGGGTGSGGGPEVIKLAKGIITDRGGDPTTDVLVIVTLPNPNLDGPRQCFNALVSYGQMSHMGVPMVIIDNTQVSKLRKSKLADSWSKVNDWIARAVHAFNAYANRPSDLGAFDGNDLNDILRRGHLLFSAFHIEGFKDKYAASDVLASHLANNLFAKCNISTAVAAGCLLIVNPKLGQEINMEDIEPALQELNKIMKPNSTLHRGIYIPNWSQADQAKHPDLFCYVILSGMEHPTATLKDLFEKARNYNQSYGSLGAFLANE